MKLHAFVCLCRVYLDEYTSLLAVIVSGNGSWFFGGILFKNIHIYIFKWLVMEIILSAYYILDIEKILDYFNTLL